MQTKLFAMNETERKIDRMMRVAANEARERGDQIQKLMKERDGWFSAFHELRMLGDVSHEAEWTEDHLRSILTASVENSEQIKEAAKTVEEKYVE